MIKCHGNLMENGFIDSDLGLLLSVQRALWDEISPSLRAVKIDWDEKEWAIYLFFYFDGQITKENTHSASCVAGEVAGDFSTEMEVVEKCIQVDFPQEIPSQRLIAFLRKEPNLQPLLIKFLHREECPSQPYLAYALQQSLLGRVISSLRSARVHVDEKNKTLQFYFYYDEKITEEIKRVSQEAISIAAQVFPPDYKIIEQIEYLPCPSRVPILEGRTVFKRKENTSGEVYRS
jgi:hypothetical protein